MNGETLQDLSAYLNWYKTVYGDNIRFDGEFDFSMEVADETISPVPKAKPEVKQQVQPKKEFIPRSAKKTFDEQLLHQGNPDLRAFYHEINKCAKCSLGHTRTNFVFGMGNPQADIMFIGEAPGRDEDMQGLPFVGKAGQLLDKMLFALQMKREEVYIANVLKCRPPNNRDPLPDEVVHCEPYLKKQIEIIKPKVIVALGRISAQVLLKKSDSLSMMRQSEHSYENIPFIVTYHPAALLRNPRWKANAWLDLQKIAKLF
ncbi:MAG: uracil-DNA glycosylase [Calditrichaeota bacterium]|nr:MAG: uracil-DNA glycosylase [Calditrichota bacterium]MBL1204146.1 uracil-DNA glycosylase [Calditrichota bacterium]NOG43977.1 uracil-DNA glycosylase [Calditrichota bacterium]